MKNELRPLEEIARFLKIRLTQPLPGAIAHEVMRAKAIGERRPSFKINQPPRDGGVLILLYEENGIVKFPLIKRPDYAGTHGGQVSLPGGKVEVGEDRVTAALRECEEEIGISREGIRVVGQLSDFHVIPSNFLVTPVVGILDQVPVFVPDAIEVARIIPATVNEIMNGALREGEIVVGEMYRLMAPHFLIDGEMVWGATAMMLSELRQVLNDLQ